MINGYRKSVVAFFFVTCVSAPTLGSSPQTDAILSNGLCAELPRAELNPEGSSDLPREVVLSATSPGSYGWVGGQLLHPVHAQCLARDEAAGVVFRACDSSDRTQIWQWKSQSPLRSRVTLSVLQHQSTGHVLELQDAVGSGGALGLGEYQVGSDAQRFAIGLCNG